FKQLQQVLLDYFKCADVLLRSDSVPGIRDVAVSSVTGVFTAGAGTAGPSKRFYNSRHSGPPRCSAVHESHLAGLRAAIGARLEGRPAVGQFRKFSFTRRGQSAWLRN